MLAAFCEGQCVVMSAGALLLCYAPQTSVLSFCMLKNMPRSFMKQPKCVLLAVGHTQIPWWLVPAHDLC